MTDEPLKVDPEIAGLLGEVALEPCPRLLTATRPSEVPGLAALREPVSTLSLSKAKAHLVEVYREEVAWLFRQASLLAVRKHPFSRCTTFVDGDRRIPLLGEGDVRVRARRAASRAGVSEGPTDGARLEDLAVDQPFDPSMASRWASVSMQVLPRDETRLVLAVALIHEGRAGAAEQVLEELLKRSSRAYDRAMALNSLGGVRSENGRFEEALELQMEASRRVVFPVAVVNGLLNACLLGDETRATRMASRLDGLLPASSPAVSEFRTMGMRVVQAKLERFRATARRVAETAGPTTRRILE